MANSPEISRRTTLALAGAAALAGARPAVAKDLKSGDPAPPFTIFTFDRQRVASTELRGKVVVLNFWATWCAPCRGEMLVMDSYVRHHPGTDLQIFAVSTEGSLPDYQLKPLAKVLSFPLASRISGRGYGVIDNSLPTSFVIDRSGVIRHAAPGAFTRDSFDAEVTPLLEEPVPSVAAPATTTS